MAAQAAGVDIGDRKALDAFMVEYNLRLMARSRWANAAESAQDRRAPRAAPPTIKPPIDVYAPCPCGSGKKYKFCCKPRG
jgi:uncharacterized protein YecA (UPF0149 family)